MEESVEKGITCPNCGSPSNSFGVYLGASTIRCLRCGFDYNHKTGEISYRGRNLNESQRQERIQEVRDHVKVIVT